ncbi:MAG: signal recognition particle receptor subunit alpha, partial [Methanobrevibacter sp.]|nr:signal recognition particle receptor subunit alpha [Methanobrevibacter sp.]
MDSAEADESGFEDSEEGLDDISEEDLDAALDEFEEAEEDPEKENSGFFSRFRRNKKKDIKSDEEIKEKSEDLDETEESEDLKTEESDGIGEESEDLKTEESDEIGEESEDLKTEESDETKDESTEDEEPLGEEEKSKRRSFFRRESKDKKESKEDSEGEKSKRGFLSFIKEKSISEDDVEDILFELELGLLEADVAMDVATKIVESVKEDLVGQKIKRGSDVEEYTINALKKAISEIIDIEGKSMTEMLEEKVAQGEPLVVMLVGINGTG